MITTDQFTRTGRRVVDMRQPKPTAALSDQLDLPFDCTLGAETETDSGEYEVTIREGCFIYPDADGEEQSVIANSAVTPETLANYDFATLIELTGQTAVSGVTSVWPIVAAVMYATTSAPDVIKAALIPLGRDLDTTTDFPDYTVHAVVPIAEVIFPEGDESPYLNQLHRGFIYVDPFGDQLDHSYLPTQLTETTAQVTPGMVYDRYGVGRSITTATNWPVDGIIDFSSPNTCFYVQIKYLSSPVASAGTFDEMLWVPAASFPSYRASLFTVNIPILEFPDNTWGGMIRRQVGNAYEGAYRHNDLGGPMQGGDAALDEFYHLTAAQVGLVDDLPYAPPYPPQDPDQPWPGVPPDYNPGDPTDWDDWWGTHPHSLLADIAAGNAGDDHVNAARGGAVVGSTSVSYLNLDGDETRNAMTSGAYIGDDANAKSIWPSGRQLMNGATVVVDWILRKLSGGAWTVTDTTAATGTTAGALVVDGGVNIKDNLIVQDTTAAGDNTGSVVAKGGVFAANGIFATNGTATEAGRFESSDRFVKLGQVGTGVEVSNIGFGGPSVKLSDATYAINATEGRINSVDGYAANGVDGWSGTFQVTQDGVTKDVTVSGGIITGVA